MKNLYNHKTVSNERYCKVKSFLIKVQLIKFFVVFFFQLTEAFIVVRE